MHRKRFITNTVFLFGTGLIAQVAGLFVLPLFIKNLGSEMYGLFVISGMITGYVGMLDFGFADGVMRQIGRSYASNDRQGVADAVSTGFWILSGIGILTALVIFFTRYWVLDFLHIEGLDRIVGSRLLTITALLSLFQWPLRLPDVLLKATLHIKAQSIIQASVALVSSLTMLVLVFCSFSIVGIRIGIGLVTLSGGVVMIVLVRRHLPEVAWNPFHFNRQTFKSMSGYSLGMFYTQLLSQLSGGIDTMIIGNMIGVGMITPYMVANKFRSLIRAYTGRLFGALLPTIISLDTEERRGKLQTLLDEGVRYRALLMSPIIYLGIVTSPTFIRVWMGSEYEQYAIWSQLFMLPAMSTIFGVAVNIARGRGHLKACNALLSIRVLVNVALSISLVPHFGIGGPILGTVVAGVLLGDAFFFPLFCKISELSFRKAWRTGWLIILTNLPVAVASSILLQHLEINSWAGLVLSLVVLICIFYASLFVIFFGESEKRDLLMAMDSVGLHKIPPLRVIIIKLFGLSSV